jgi:hypothetical protein
MSAGAASLEREIADAGSIDRDQAKNQIEKCEAQLKAEEASGKELAEAHRYLKIARSFFRLGSFTKAFLFAVRARRIAKERGAGRAQ